MNELAPFVGGTEAAKATVNQVIDSLGDSFDSDQIREKLEQEVAALKDPAKSG